MDGNDDDIIERMRDNADAFAPMTDARDDRINGGGNAI